MNTPVFRQSWTMSAVFLNMIVQGMLLSYPTSLVPGLRDPNSSIKVDLNTAYWLASSMAWACIIGFLLAYALMDKLGRKITHIICIIPGLMGWLLIFFATDIPTIMCGRVIGGISAGGSVSLGAIIVGEYTSPEYRGVFLNLKTAGIYLGSMFLHLISYSLSWRDIALVAVAVHGIALLITITWPESPAWLASIQKYNKSKQAFYWLRSRNETSRKEINEMITEQMNSTKRERNSTISCNVAEFFMIFTRRHFLKPLMVAVVGNVLVETCGRHFFPAYATQIISEVANEKLDVFYYTLVLDAVITASAVISSVLVKIIKRRTLLFSTGFAAVAVLATICVYLFLASRDIISKGRTWIPFSLLIAYFMLANLGCTPIPLALLGEVFPLAYRGVSTFISGVSISLLAAMTLQLTPQMIAALGVHGMFAVFGGITVVTLVIFKFILPETKDKTLQEIEYYFKYGKYERVEANEEEAKVKMMETN